MTVVSYLKLSKDVGMGCADERETHDFGGTQRTYDVTRKIFRLGALPIFVGTAGSVSNSRQVIELANSRVKYDFSYGDALQALRDAYHEIKSKDFKESVLDRYGVTWHDFTSGNFDPDLKKTVREALDRGEQGFGVRLLVGGYDSNGSLFKVHTVVYPGHVIYHERTDSIGSGFDIAEMSINNAVANLSPTQRDSIEKYLGARILMEAAQSAWRNFGVGGRTQLVWVERDSFNELGGDESNMLNTALFCERKNVLGREYVDGLFKRIIHEKAKAEELLPETRERISPEDLAKLFWTQSLHV